MLDGIDAGIPSDWRDRGPRPGMQMISWPRPFDGIEICFRFKKEQDLNWAIQQLFKCGHLHNFAVQADGKALHVSRSGQECLGKAIIDHGNNNVRRGEDLPEV
jgi:hypothetical protein